MANVYLITGFNNWGKTHLIKALFGKEAFRKGVTHSHAGNEFCVIPQSNDDLGQAGYAKRYGEYIASLDKKGITPTHILSAFCPTGEPHNDSAKLINSLYRNDDVHMILLKHKWCGHAQLQIRSIEDYYAGIRNLKIHSLTQTNPNNKLADLKSLLAPIL
ncbi:hypothetical protein [Cupriavidus basilensis]|uniref:hypothetical protein n=1 Tax=Cupriavidus basilensis TaxID=68895 RepID=UPI0011464501|nr:hypothetical protein [Cupriavidus basilensis]